jgi:hypothetical protein
VVPNVVELVKLNVTLYLRYLNILHEGHLNWPYSVRIQHIYVMQQRVNEYNFVITVLTGQPFFIITHFLKGHLRECNSGQDLFYLGGTILKSWLEISYIH